MEDAGKFIDTHAHLDDPAFSEDLDEVMERARGAGVDRIITVGTWSAERGFDPVVELLEQYDNLYAALGVHPHDAARVTDDSPYRLIEKLAGELRAPDGTSRVVAVGEAGLDFHYDNSPREKQTEVFARQVGLARRLNLPLIVHTREAPDETIKVLEDEGAGEVGGVFHCFSGDKALAEKALEMGFYISFSGIITFKKAEELRRVAGEMPNERMLIETDCPYLAPEPKRGKRNEPALVVETARVLAEARGLTLDDVGRITTVNAEELFGLGGAEEARIAYRIRNSLYLNITNRCTNYCTFCAKFKSYTVKGHYLRLGEEPSFEDVIRAVGPDPTQYDEIVFCGFGEPLIRLDLVKKVGMFLKRMGCRIRVDTDGLANLVHERNVLSELMFVDCVSVSLNAPDSETYQEIVKTPYGDNSYPAILFFLREAKKYIQKVVATVVAVPGLDVEACRKVAEDDLGVEFRVRQYNRVG